MEYFWHQLPKPIIGQSPMDGVSDAAFRFITAKYGKPDVLFTEFTHVQGLWAGRIEVYKDFLYHEIERPIVAQIFGADADYFYKAAHICCELGFDGIDINMGCPANNIVKKGGGASLILDPKRAQRIIRKTKQGVADWVAGQSLKDLGIEQIKIDYLQNYPTYQTHWYSPFSSAHPQEHRHAKRPKEQLKRVSVPVSVKTRIGYDKVVIQEWVSQLLEAEPVAITMHGRTLKQLYHGLADWEAMGSVSEKIHKAGVVYLGNGDVKSIDQAEEQAKIYGMDGVLIGRASFGNPWIFRKKSALAISPTQKLDVAIEHAHLHQHLKGSHRFHEIRKHLGWYCKDFDHARELRIQLVTAQTAQDVERMIAAFFTQASV